MEKYTVEARMWVKQVRPGGRSGEYEMTREEAERIQENLIKRGVSVAEIRVRGIR